MRALDLVLGMTLGLGMLGFAAWTIRVYVTSEPPKIGATELLIYRCGQGFIWLAALVAGGAVLGGVARAVWGVIG